jgi:hypothetical protein
MINVIYNLSNQEILDKQREVFDDYCKIIQWGRMHPDLFMEQFLGVELLDHQRYVIMSTWAASTSAWIMSRSSGKAQVLETPVYIKDSTGKNKYQKKTIGDLKVGDFIYDNEGKLTQVIHLNPIIFDNVYEIEFEDGEKIQCNKEHLWQVYDEYIGKILLVNTLYIKENIKENFSVPVCTSFDSFSQKYKKIISVESTNKQKAMRCITVDNKTGLYLCGNHATVTHNSFLSAPYVMTRSILIPNHKSYIMAPAGSQAQETFLKMEDLAKGNIASALGVTTVFLSELVHGGANATGFVHDKNSYHCALYNGSEVNTLNSVAKNIVGKFDCRFKMKSNVLFI